MGFQSRLKRVPVLSNGAKYQGPEAWLPIGDNINNVKSEHIFSAICCINQPGTGVIAKSVKTLSHGATLASKN